MWTDVFPGNMLLFFSAVQKVFELHAQKSVSTASHPDEALPVFALFLTAGVAASRRRAGRARRHRPVCLSWPPDRYTK